jgi:large conductance mechanosensitive channel
MGRKYLIGHRLTVNCKNNLEENIMGALKDFRDFILRGNVVDLAVGIIIGAAFGAVVGAVVKDLITPLIGIFGGFDFSSWYFTVNKSKFLIGDFINVLLTFIIVAAVVFFLVVRPVNSLMAIFKKPEPEVSDMRDCPYCKSSISKQATRCAYCTSEVQAVAA